MTALVRQLERTTRRGLAGVDALLNRLHGSHLNPVYHSGRIAVALLVVLIVTGLYLLLFYRVSAPYTSMERIQEQVWLGRWIRSLHRFAADASIVAIAVHALKMFAQSRSWGPRLMAWATGSILLLFFLVIGWTGYVLVWDVQAQVLAMEGARLMDVLPILSEPLSRTFVGERPLPSAFFFMNLFLHVALPIGLGLVLWLHVARQARARLMPPRQLTWGVIGVLTLVSILWPVELAPEADLFRLPEQAPYDFFYAFWLPLSQALPPAAAWAAALVLGGVLLLVPLWTRPKRSQRPLPSAVNERLCTGCEQCADDCPYEAITMVPRTDGRAGLVAKVETSACVSCGICIASCAPMGIGPWGRTGRDQLTDVRQFLAARKPGPKDVVIIGCVYGGGGVGVRKELDGAPVLPVSCAGSLHTSVIEHLIRSGVGGVMVVSCPPDDCRNREGAKWVEQRLFHGREAELKERVDRRRIRLVHAGEASAGHVRAELADFRKNLAPSLYEAEDEIDILALCERAQEEVG
jgi:NAD-dependent dihydropyrimidine dehydrogenase PreA subunit/coenzyme F420-reducing hydrogenase delta subunit